MTRDQAIKIAVEARKSYNAACWLAWSHNLIEPRGDIAERIYGYRHGWFYVQEHAFNGDDLDVAEHGRVYATYDID
jgi:hypothetical protein